MSKLTGAGYLDIICGSSSISGLAQKNPDDAEYRRTALQWINLVIKDLSSRQNQWHWKFLEKSATFPTVADQHTYDLPTDIDTQKVVALYDRTNDLAYQFMPYDEFARRVPDPSNESGDPTIYTIFATVLRLYPTPSEAVTTYMDYIKVMTYLSDDANTCDIPEKYEGIVIDGILVYVYRFDPSLGNPLNQQRIYESGVQRMINENRQVIGELTENESHRGKWGYSERHDAAFSIGNF